MRVVHRWFASTGDWDDQFEGHTYGWLAFFRILKLYLTHFHGQQCSAFQLSALSNAPLPKAWRAVTDSLRYLQMSHKPLLRRPRERLWNDVQMTLTLSCCSG